MMRSAIVTLGLVCALSYASAAEPISVYLVSPDSVRSIQQMEALVKQLPDHRRRWQENRQKRITYVVTQRSLSMFAPDPCEGLPVRVSISGGELQSATYLESGGECRQGQPARKIIGRFELDQVFLPDQLFLQLSSLESAISCHKRGDICSKFYAVFHKQLGFPIKIERYLGLDSGWVLEVSEVEVVQ